MFIEKHHVVHMVRLRWGRIFHWSFFLYKHVMPPASFHTFKAFPNPEDLYGYRNFNCARNLRPRRGRISFCCPIFYKHVMPPASFHCDDRFPKPRGVCMFIER